LSQFEQRQGALRHCSACTEYGHDKQTCGGVGQLGISGVAVHLCLGLCLCCQIILFYSMIRQ
jgi:hypothetical protein